MLTLAVGLLNNRAAADDVVQDVFLSFARSARDLRSQGSLRGYLMTGVLNRVRDHRRHLGRQALCTDAAEPADPACESAGPEQAAIRGEEAIRLSDAIAELPDEQRETVLLRLKANMKLRDIARLQQTSTSTVLGRYRYGLDRPSKPCKASVRFTYRPTSNNAARMSSGPSSTSKGTRFAFGRKKMEVPRAR